ncbi:MAG TPA: endonuclease/exonuclease/phosphatase family protein [Pseudobdellovibrionaceae bacterium]|nr:endonuclease/exonuclease/phosphatase family protein [Pseudobdellovibrionaceae bacterium]
MSSFEDREWRFVAWNVENLFVLLDEPISEVRARIEEDQRASLLGEAGGHRRLTESEWQNFSRSTTKNKSLEHCRQIAAIIRELNPDILMLSEVGGAESLANFANLFLNGEWQSQLIEGNSDRGIDVGYLVRRDLGFVVELNSHRERELGFLYPHESLSRESGYTHLRHARRESHRFSRDAAELRLLVPSTGQVALICLLAHLKSHLDRHGLDPGGRDRRRAEAETLLQIYRERREEFGDAVLVAGDFNGDLWSDDEFKAWRENQGEWLDVLEAIGASPEEKFTWARLHRRRPGYYRQIDYILVPPSWRTRLKSDETWVYRYKDVTGRTRMIPTHIDHKRGLPSDHYPVILTLVRK